MKHNITFREVTKEDVDYVGRHLREADALEVRSCGFDPLTALRLSVQESDYAWTGLIDGEPSMVFGCGQSLLAEKAFIFALGTDKCTTVPREMLIYGRKKVREMLEIYPEMENFCDGRYKAAHRWLMKLGFTVHEAKPYGPFGVPFCKISVKKEEK